MKIWGDGWSNFTSWESCLEVVCFQNPILRQLGACSKLWMKQKSLENGICLSKCKKKKKSDLPFKENYLIHIHAVLKFWLVSTPFLKIENWINSIKWILKYMCLPQTTQKHRTSIGYYYDTSVYSAAEWSWRLFLKLDFSKLRLKKKNPQRNVLLLTGRVRTKI